MHSVLARQMRRVGLTLDDVPADLDSWKRFLERVEGYYEDADQGRYLLERSLRHSTDELTASNERLTRFAEEEIAKREARYRDLFQLNKIATWEENFIGAAKALEELRAQGVTDIQKHVEDNRAALVDIITRVVVVDANPAVARLVGTESTEDLLGPVTEAMIDDDNAPAWIVQLKAIWDGVGSARIDHLTGTRMNGETFHGVLEWHAPLVGRHFDYRRVVVSIVDITELMETKRNMQKVLDSKDEFLASISHELRTPLTSVLGFAEVLQEMGSETPKDERDSLLGIIATQASDLSDIVEDLLVAARAELGQLTVGSVPVDLHAQVAQILEAGSNLSEPVQVPGRPNEPIKGLGDPQRVRQILRNLITNATKYGGDQIGVEIERETDEVVVRVVDNGTGLDQESAGRVFDRYYRSKPDENLTGSVGIGLTISRDLARMMNGDLVHERRDGLTVFTLRLPRLKEQV